MPGCYTDVTVTNRKSLNNRRCHSYKFTSSTALALTKSGTYETPRSVGRPHSSRDDNPQLAKKQNVPTEVPIGDVRYNNIAH